MEAQNPCPNHQNIQINSVCISKSCQFSHLFCKSCLQKHYTHHVIPYEQFELKYGSFQQVVQNSIKKIRQNFLKIKQTFALCIKRAQQKVIKQIVSSVYIPKLKQTQIQQRYGVINDIISNQIFVKILSNSIQIQDYKKNQDHSLQNLGTNVDELNTNIMSSINKFMTKLITNANNISIIKSIPVQLPPTYFKFSQKYKPKDYQITQNGKSVRRSTILHQGLSMYCVTQQPFSKQYNSISFTISHQNRRFIYLGVCDNETFKNFNFKGNLYEKGNKMYAIRQSTKQGANAVCLHNSLQAYSNKDKVPWDFTIGDIINIKYNQDNNCIVFTKNAQKNFEMPLDKSIKKFYPFVGLKFQGDTVKILSQDGKKKGIFANLF